MTRRMLDSRLWANEHFGEMPMMARLLLLGIINHADDQGRIKAKLSYLRTEIFRYDDDVTNDQVAECLKRIQANGTIKVYEADGKEYVQLMNWWEYQSLQFAIPSDYPAPKDWCDRLRFNGKGGVMHTYNWRKVDGSPTPDNCNERGELLSTTDRSTPQSGNTPAPSEPLIQVSSDLPAQLSSQLSTQDQKEDQDQDQYEVKAEAERAAPPAAAIDPDVARVWEAWHANMPGTKSQVVTDGVNALLDEYSAAEIVEAIAIACRRHKRSLGYIEGILQKGVFNGPPITRGGDYSTNNGIAAVTGYLLEKGMRNGQH